MTVVGSRHLIGRAGILNFLQQEGFTVERMTGKNTYEKDPDLLQLKDMQVDLALDDFQHRIPPAEMLYYRRLKQQQCDEKEGQGRQQRVNSPNAQMIPITSNRKVIFR